MTPDMGAGEPLVTGPGEPGLVSVVIPTYNRAYIVGEAIESVLRQTYRPVEVVVADDGSADDTRRVVEAFGPPVRYCCQPNAGVCAARNLGFRHARGEFVAMLDSDDRWLPWKAEAQVRLLRAHPDVGMVWTDMVATDEAGAVTDPAFLRKYYSAHKQVRIEDAMRPAGTLRGAWPEAPAEVAGRPFYRGDVFSPVLLGNLVHTSTAMLRRERLARVGGFDLSLVKSGEDYEFHLWTCYHGRSGSSTRRASCAGTAPSTSWPPTGTRCTGRGTACGLCSGGSTAAGAESPCPRAYSASTWPMRSGGGGGGVARRRPAVCPCRPEAEPQALAGPAAVGRAVAVPPAAGARPPGGP